jgi:hypothetical protein
MERKGSVVQFRQNGMTMIRPRDTAELRLREMVAHLNVMDASIDTVVDGSDMDTALAAHELLNRLDVLSFTAARLRIRDASRVTQALEALVLARQARAFAETGEVSATMRHGVDVLMLLTHDTVRRQQGHPAADLYGAVEAFLERVHTLLTGGATFGTAA